MPELVQLHRRGGPRPVRREQVSVTSRTRRRGRGSMAAGAGRRRCFGQIGLGQLTARQVDAHARCSSLGMRVFQCWTGAGLGQHPGRRWARSGRSARPRPGRRPGPGAPGWVLPAQKASTPPAPGGCLHDGLVEDDEFVRSRARARASRCGPWRATAGCLIESCTRPGTAGLGQVHGVVGSPGAPRGSVLRSSTKPHRC